MDNKSSPDLLWKRKPVVARDRHIAMEPAKRDHLYREFRRRLARRHDGRLPRHWGAVLHVARRRDQPPGGRPPSAR